MADNDLFYEVYDDIFADKDYTGEVRSVLKSVLGEEQGTTHILDIGAGTGNHSIACARLGYNVTAVEIDPNMLRIMRGKLKKEPHKVAKRVHSFGGSVEKLDKNDFTLAIAMFNVINYLSSLESLLSFMNGVSRSLLPRGSFVFDAWNGVAAMFDPPGNTERHIETAEYSICVKLASDTDFMRMKTRLTYEIERTSKTKNTLHAGTHQINNTLWHPKIIEDSAAIAGLTVQGIYPLKDFSRSATEHDWKILFHCQKL